MNVFVLIHSSLTIGKCLKVHPEDGQKISKLIHMQYLSLCHFTFSIEIYFSVIPSCFILKNSHFSVIFGSPDLSEREPINSLSYVRSFVRSFVGSFVRQFRSYSLDRSKFFSNFLHEVVSPYDSDDHQKIFRSKNFLTPKMAKNGQN